MMLSRVKIKTWRLICKRQDMYNLAKYLRVKNNILATSTKRLNMKWQEKRG